MAAPNGASLSRESLEEDLVPLVGGRAREDRRDQRWPFGLSVPEVDDIEDSWADEANDRAWQAGSRWRVKASVAALVLVALVLVAPALRSAGRLSTPAGRSRPVEEAGSHRNAEVVVSSDIKKKPRQALRAESAVGLRSVAPGSPEAKAESAEDLHGILQGTLAAEALPSPSLFCFSVAQLGTTEERLMRMQVAKRCGIFQCDEAAVLAREKVLLGRMDSRPVYTWKVDMSANNQMGRYGVGGQTTNSFLNTGEFIVAWNVLTDSGHLWKYDFVLKLDPDCVFFHDRARPRLLPYVGQAVYFTNCGKYSLPLLYGAMEVYSKEAIAAYSNQRGACAAMDWRGKWGEDFYMQKCMDDVLHVRGVLDRSLVGDKRCEAATCSDWTKAAFHDYKAVDSWLACWSQATGLPA